MKANGIGHRPHIRVGQRGRGVIRKGELKSEIEEESFISTLHRMYVLSMLYNCTILKDQVNIFPNLDIGCYVSLTVRYGVMVFVVGLEV